MAIRLVEQENPDGMDPDFSAYHALKYVLEHADLVPNPTDKYGDLEGDQARAFEEECVRCQPEEAKNMLEERIVNKFVVGLEKFGAEEEGSV